MPSCYMQENGKRAVETITNFDIGMKNKEAGMPDIVLMDIQLPEMSGYDATKKIKEINKGLPVIAVTANAMAEEKRKLHGSWM